MIDACSQLITEQVEVPDTGRFEEDVTAFLSRIATLLQTARWSSVVPSIIDAAWRDADLARVHSTIQQGHAVPLEEIITRAVRRGEILASTDPSALTAILLGPLFYRRWFSRGPLDDEFVKTVVKTVVGPS